MRSQATLADFIRSLYPTIHTEKHGFAKNPTAPAVGVCQEYLGMFNLSEDDLARDIIDVGGGTASFNALMHQRDTPIVSVDPIYRYSEVELRQRIQDTYDDVIAQARQNRDKFVWTHIASVDELSELRLGFFPSLMLTATLRPFCHLLSTNLKRMELPVRLNAFHIISREQETKCCG